MSIAILLDRKESSKDCHKYRRDRQIIIVNHGGKGWWDPQQDSNGGKGDVFALVKFLDPSQNFGWVRQYFRPLAGKLPNPLPFGFSPKPDYDAIPIDKTVEPAPAYHDRLGRIEISKELLQAASVRSVAIEMFGEKDIRPGWNQQCSSER